MKCINTSVCSLALNLIGIVLTKFSLLIIKIDVVCEAYYFVMYVCTYLVRYILEFLSSFEESFRRKEINVAQTDIYIYPSPRLRLTQAYCHFDLFHRFQMASFCIPLILKGLKCFIFFNQIRKTVPLSKYLISII